MFDGPERRPSVTVICAPAGFGKSTMMAAWIAHQPEWRRHAHQGWLTLDPTDNAPAILWADVLTSLGTTGCRPRPADWLATSPPDSSHAQRFVTAVGEAVRGRRGSTCLVLDDLHDLSEQEALDSLDLLIRYQPKDLDLVLCSRTMPPLGLHRISAEGRVWEFTASDLAFSRAQAATVFTRGALRLTEDGLDQLMTTTEGWPAGVSLVAEALVGSPADTEIDSLVRADRQLADYLIAEVVAKLSSAECDVLTGVSVCDHFTTDLATALTRRLDAGAVLERLEHRTLLLHRWGPRSDEYGCHGLLQSHLRNQLSERAPQRLAELHRRAAVWFAGHDEPLTALHHGAASGDEDLLARLTDTEGLSLILAGRGDELRGLASRLSRSVTTRAAPGLVLALADLVAGDKHSAEQRLAGLGKNGGDERSPRARQLRVCVEQYRARLSGELPASSSGAPATDLRHPDLTLLTLINQATADFARGHYAPARDVLTKALSLATKRDWHYAALHCLSHLAALTTIDRGDFPSVLADARIAVTYAADHGLADTPAVGLAHTVAGWAGYQMLDSVTARTHAQRATELLGPSNDHNVRIAVQLIASAVELDDPACRGAALGKLRESWANVTPSNPVQPDLVAAAAPIEHRAALSAGHLDWAIAVEHRTNALLGKAGETTLLRAHRLSRAAKPEQAREAVNALTADDVAYVAPLNQVQALLLAATVTQREHGESRALRHLQAALELAVPLHALRPFEVAGQPIRHLVAVSAGKLGRSNAFADEVLAKTRRTPDTGRLGFTPRERQLLKELPSPATTQELAQALNISVNTLKTHLRSTYRKLGVRNRREAVIAARRNDLC
ncbi:MAG TPA: LuxR C-terminal-related transcriptional regulator [Amycolatopsis sp.]|nr:LuxR C-terminal-related transcriptional regulator [Amycolatopsis sp.]